MCAPDLSNEAEEVLVEGYLAMRALGHLLYVFKFTEDS